MKRMICILMACLLGSAACLAQSSPTGERKGVRRGNRDFRKEQWQDAEINYKKALVADSTSATADYNLANTYYRMENYSEADRYLRAGADSLAKGNHAADLFHNQGNVMLKQRNWQGAIEAYKNALRRNPGDMETKSNLAYAQKMLENEQQNGGGGNNDQNQDQNQNQDQQDQNQDQ
ncbi:MAG: tetratricopeptide repeat protein, partial [Bacteroidales bacterium]|nr:tetratricopeptide repeat protein [Bacteroidales bacterium]